MIIRTCCWSIIEHFRRISNMRYPLYQFFLYLHLLLLSTSCALLINVPYPSSTSSSCSPSEPLIPSFGRSRNFFLVNFFTKPLTFDHILSWSQRYVLNKCLSTPLLPLSYFFHLVIRAFPRSSLSSLSSPVYYLYPIFCEFKRLVPLHHHWIISEVHSYPFFFSSIVDTSLLLHSSINLVFFLYNGPFLQSSHYIVPLSS